MVRCCTGNVLHMKKCCRFFYCLPWFDIVEFNSLQCPNDKFYDDVVFADRFRYQLIMFGIRVLIKLSRLLNAHIAYETVTAKTIAAFSRISYFCIIIYGWIQSTAESKRQDVRWFIFADRFRYPLTTFANRVLIWLSRLIHAHIAYETDTAKIIAAFCRISYSLHDLIRWTQSSAMLKQQDIRNIVFTDRLRYQLTMFEVCVLIWQSRLLYTHIAYEIVI